MIKLINLNKHVTKIIQYCGGDININNKVCDHEFCNEVKCYNETCDVYSNIIPEKVELICEDESTDFEENGKSFKSQIVFFMLIVGILFFKLKK